MSIHVERFDTGDVLVDRTEYFNNGGGNGDDDDGDGDGDGGEETIMVQAVVLPPGQYVVLVHAAYARPLAGRPGLSYRQPAPCGVEQWKFFDEDAPFTCPMFEVRQRVQVDIRLTSPVLKESPLAWFVNSLNVVHCSFKPLVGWLVKHHQPAPAPCNEARNHLSAKETR